MDDIEILNNKYLGHGYISTVKMARDRRTGQTLAVKIVY
jgi:hypothetical protein